jgi:hypothetical protein
MILAEAPPFQVPDPVSTAGFGLIVASVVVAVVLGVRFGGPPGEDPQQRLRWTGAAVAFASGWLVLTGGLVVSGFLAQGPAAAMIYVMGSMVAAVALAGSRVGARLASLPLVALVAFQGFRFPLELVLHAWYEQGTLPVQMTWEGQNLDVLTGLLALGVGAVGLLRELPRWLVWIFELVGSVLLLNVMRVAVTSAPGPLRSFLHDPPVLLPFYLPYTWIVSVCVAGALLGHLVLLRRLIGRAA